MLDDRWIPNFSEGPTDFGSADKSSASAPENTHVTRASACTLVCEFTWLSDVVDEAGAVRDTTMQEPQMYARKTHVTQS